MAFPKYQTKEVLNKILNSAETAIQVDIVAGAEYAEDAAHTSADTGNFILGVRNDTLAALGGTDGDYVPFQMNSSGALFVDIADGGVLESAVDGLETLLTAANVDHAANEALLITIDEDTNAIKGHVDGIETLITSTNSKIDTFDAVLDAIKTDTQEIEEAVETIETAIKAEDAAHSSGDTGIMSLAVRNDDVAALSGTDGDYSPLQVNAAGSLYTKDETGEAGSILVTGTTAVTTTVTANTKFIAIQFIEDSVFDSGNDGLISATDQLYPSTQFASTSVDADGGAVADSVTFPQGMTIFGRWSGFKLASGKVIAYIGYV